MSHDETFADGIGGIGYVAGTVRVELVRFDPHEKEADGSPRREPRHTLILTEPGFMELLNGLHQTHQRILAMQQQQAQQQAGQQAGPQAPVSSSAPAPAPASAPAPAKGASPNFPES